LATYSTSSKKQIEERVSKDDFDFIISSAESKTITPKALSLFIEAIEKVPKSPLPAVPLELYSVTVCS
jgi:hypothetical protein